MKRLLYAFFAGLLLFVSSTVNAQNEESTVVISEENLTVLISKLRAYRLAKNNEAKTANIVSYNKVTYDSVSYNAVNKSNLVNETELSKTSTLNVEEKNYLKEQIARLENELILIRTTKDTTANAINDENNLSLKNINKELVEIRLFMEQLSNKPNEVETITATPKTRQVEYVAPKKEREPKSKKNIIPIVPIVTVKNNDADYNKLQANLDSLRSEISTSKMPITSKDSLLVSEQANYDAEFIALQNQLEAMKLELETKNSALTTYEVLKAKFKDYKKSVFFGNNSVALNPEAKISVDELYALLNENENLDVIVKGFASNKGNPKYNENLSMQRTEAIKKALMLRGVHPTRVLTQYHGIDYNATDAASARRVEASFLVRK